MCSKYSFNPIKTNLINVCIIRDQCEKKNPEVHFNGLLIEI